MSVRTSGREALYEIPYDSDSQAVCLCLEVLEHIQDDALAAREIARVLEPGGILIVAVPHTYYWPQYKELIGHLRHYTRSSLTDLLESAGLRVECSLPNYPNWHHAYSRCYVRTRVLSLLLGPLLRQKGVFDFRWPWTELPAMEGVSRRLHRLREADLRESEAPT